MSTESIRVKLRKNLKNRVVSLRETFFTYVRQSVFKDILLDVLDEIDSISGGGGGFSGGYAMLTKSSNQSGVTTGDDISFQTSVLSTGLSFSTPELSLPSGNVWLVCADVTTFSHSVTGGFLEYEIVDDSNTPFTGGKIGVTRNVADTGRGEQGGAWAIVDATGGAVDVKVRVTGATGTATVDIEGTGLRAHTIA